MECACYPEQYFLLGLCAGFMGCLCFVKGLNWRKSRRNKYTEDEDKDSSSEEDDPGYDSDDERVQKIAHNNDRVQFFARDELVRDADTAGQQELFEMFQEEQHNPTETAAQQKLRKELANPSINLVKPSFGTRYASLQSLHRRNTEHNEKASALVLSRREELAILDRFRSLEGTKFDQLSELLSEKGYSLHPIYINNKVKRVREEYSNKVIGVRVKDSEYDGFYNKFSPDAIVTDLIDVGGQDLYNRGQIL